MLRVSSCEIKAAKMQISPSSLEGVFVVVDLFFLSIFNLICFRVECLVAKVSVLYLFLKTDIFTKGRGERE